MKPDSLMPLKRPEYKPDLATRLAQERAERAEPQIKPLSSNTPPRGRWAYEQENE